MSDLAPDPSAAAAPSPPSPPSRHRSQAPAPVPPGVVVPATSVDAPVAPAASPEPPDWAHQLPDREREARAALSRGWALTPLKGKKPTLTGWTTLPPADEKTLLGWAFMFNLGVRTGQISGVVVVDDDTPELNAAEKLGLPVTATVRTGSGKLHYYFKCPPGGVRNSAGKLLENVDVRGDGGQVVAAGSRHPDTKLQYAWEPGLSPEEVAIADLPQAIVELLAAERAAKAGTGAKEQKKFDRRERRGKALHKRVTAALETCVERVRTAQPGTRNQTLNQYSYFLGRFVGAGAVSDADVRAKLTEAALAAGLEEGETAKTIESGLTAGIADPMNDEELELTPARASAQADGEDFDFIWEGFRLSDAADFVDARLASCQPPVAFQRGMALVRVACGGGGGRRGDEPARLVQIEAIYLRDLMTRLARWGREVESGMAPIACPVDVARTYVARTGKWSVPNLRGLTACPIVREDGSICSMPGFDLETGLWLDIDGDLVGPMPEAPTREDAQRAFERLVAPLSQFPFVSAADLSVFVCALLTPFVRSWLPSAPLIALSAPTMASGKSLLADLVGILATGRNVPVISQGQDSDEDRKRITSILREGQAIVSIDNIMRPLSGDALCSILTQPIWQDRVLGSSETLHLPTNVTWLATGNNLQVAGDLRTRVLLCRLDAGIEHPEERKFDLNPRAYFSANRGTLIADALTIIAAYAAVPDAERVSPVTFGRFEAWSSWVREPLIWIGQADCVDVRREVDATDASLAELRAVMSAWRDVYGDQRQQLGWVIRSLREPGGGEEIETLRDALQAVALGRDGRICARRLGRYFSQFAHRVHDGLAFEQDGSHAGSSYWRLVPRGSAPSPLVGLVGLEGPVSSPSRERDSYSYAHAHIHTRVRVVGTETDPPNPPNPPTRDDGQESDSGEATRAAATNGAPGDGRGGDGALL